MSNRSAAVIGSAFGLAIAALLWTLWKEDPIFFSKKLRIAVPLAINGALLALFFWERSRQWTPAALVTLLYFSNAGVNPIMRGLSPLIDSAAFSAIGKIHAAEPDAKWIVYDSRYFAQLVKASGAPVFNGTKIVPDLPFLYQLDPGGAHDWIYNRYANIVCELPRYGYQVSAGLAFPDLYTWFSRLIFPNCKKPVTNMRFSPVRGRAQFPTAFHSRENRAGELVGLPLYESVGL